MEERMHAKTKIESNLYCEKLRKLLFEKGKMENYPKSSVSSPSPKSSAGLSSKETSITSEFWVSISPNILSYSRKDNIYLPIVNLK